MTELLALLGVYAVLTLSLFYATSLRLQQQPPWYYIVLWPVVLPMLIGMQVVGTLITTLSPEDEL